MPTGQVSQAPSDPAFTVLVPTLTCLGSFPLAGAREDWFPAVQSGRPQPKYFYFDILGLGTLVQVPKAPPPSLPGPGAPLGLVLPSYPVLPTSPCPLGWGPHPLNPAQPCPAGASSSLCLPPCSLSGATSRSLHTVGRPLSCCLLCLSSPLPFRAVPTRPEGAEADRDRAPVALVTPSSPPCHGVRCLQMPSRAGIWLS